ncbi:NAD(P)H-dependent oxidoreductase [Paraburkholderia xenovorans]|uniref:FMN-dependent NADH-azoreductase n=1 Tax=Paraburkholderia xenovorans TaxID=36873 RepID=UPI0038BD397D
MKILHINSSPRNVDSQSLQIADFLIHQLKKRRSLEVDRYDLFTDELPAFDQTAVGAKMALFTGAQATAEQERAWGRMRQVFDRFASADAYVINVPLWNNGLPYILKQFIDVVTQPGWAFGFDMEKGYSGLLKSKKACVIHASGVYRQGIPASFGSDFSTPYVGDWLKFIGVEHVEQIHFAPTVVNPDLAATRSAVEQKAIEIAERL